MNNWNLKEVEEYVREKGGILLGLGKYEFSYKDVFGMIHYVSYDEI